MKSFVADRCWTEIMVGRVVSCPWIFANIMFLSVPDMRPDFSDKHISHSGRAIQEGVIVQRRNMAASFELDLSSFADFLSRVSGDPCGHHVDGFAFEAGRGENWAFKNLSFPQGEPGAV